MNNQSNKHLGLLFGVLFLGSAIGFVKFYILPKYTNKTLPEVVSTVSLRESAKEDAEKEEPAIQSPDFTLDSSVYKGEAVTVISNFEKENASSTWQGNGVADQKLFFEGEQSLGLVSTDHKIASVFLEKSIDFSNMKSIEFMLNVTDAEAYESAIIDFGNADMKAFYRYSLTNLKNGWNLIQIPKDKFILSKPADLAFDWSQVQKVKFSLISRPSSVFWVRLDMMRSINDPDKFLSHWRTTKPDAFLSIFEQEGKTKLMARNMGANTAVLKDVEDINNFAFSATISPQTSGRSGLFIRGNYNNGYGYYFLIGGDRKNNWQIMKRNKDGWTPKEEIIEGVLQNVVFSKDKNYTLKAEANGDVMTFFFSFDGEKFEKLGEVKDNEFRGGGIGITVFDGGSWSLFDDFQFKRL